MKKLYALPLVSLLLLTANANAQDDAFTILPDANNVLYVNSAAAPGGDGSSWASALASLETALSAANNINATASAPEDLVRQIWVAKGTYQPSVSGLPFLNFTAVKIYGGFAGTEQSLSERNLSGGNKSILKGNDGSVFGSLHRTGVVVFDGFEVTGGNVPTGSVGGIGNSSGKMIISNCIISNNFAGLQAGGVGNDYGGDLTVINSVIANNTAENGGGFSNNGNLQIINCVITNNTAQFGGAVSNLGTLLRISNSIIWNNTTTVGNHNLAEYTDANLVVTYSIVEGGYPGTGNLNLDPEFVDPAIGDYRLKVPSPGINAGMNDSIPAWTITDLAGNPRIYNKIGGGIVDLGAYEYQITSFTPGAGNILYVNQNVSGGNGSGDSWANAIPELADALRWARQRHDLDNNWLQDDSLRIFIAIGSYQPLYNAADGAYTTDGGRDNSFVMVKNVQLYGGFDPENGIEHLDDARILPNHLGGSGESLGTILNGDVGTTNDHSDNTYHVVISSGDVGKAGLNGLTISAGNADGEEDIVVNGIACYRGGGGGMINMSSSPHLLNSLVSNNLAHGPGGGIYNYNSSSPSILNTTISNNSAGSGGGMYNFNSSSPTVVNVIISYNSVQYDAGGMYNYSSSSPTIINTRISNNFASQFGGGMGNESSSSPTISNTTISNNLAGIGGGICNFASSPVINNSIVFGNQKKEDFSSSNVFNENSSTPVFTYSLIGGATSWNADWGADGGNNIVTDSNPFADTTNADFSLILGTAAINGGSNPLYTDAGGDLTNDTDLAGNARVFDLAAGGIVDMGAYEFQGSCPTILIAEQPLENTVCLGAEINFTVEASGGDLTYQWQFSSDGGSSFIDLVENTVYSGVATATLTLSEAGSEMAGLYRCVIRNECSTMESGIASLGVTLIEITGVPPEGIVDVPYEFTFAVSGGTEPYTWSVPGDGLPDWLWLNTETGEISGIPESSKVVEFTLQAEDASGCSATVAVNLTIAPGEASIVTFPPLEAVVYGAADLNPGASSSDGREVEYVSSNPDVARITADGFLKIVGAGTAQITASLPQNPNYDDALPVTRELVVNPATLTVTANNDSKTYDGIAYTGGNGVTVTGWQYDDTDALLTGTVAYSGDAQGATHAGSYVILPGGYTSENYEIEYRSGTLTIEKAPLAIKADNKTRKFGQADPVFTFTYSGFVNGEDESDLKEGPAATTTATDASLPGTYPITPGGASSENYWFNYANGRLTVIPATRRLTFDPLAEKTYGDADFDPGAVVTGSSDEVIYTSSDPGVAQIVEGMIRITGAGSTQITATLPPNEAYENTPAITRKLVVLKAPQTINFAQIGDVSRDAGVISVDVTTSSGLPVSLSSSDLQVARVARETVLEILRLGTTLITAVQPGNANYLPAEPLTRELKVVSPEGKLVKVHQVVSPNSDGINEFLLVEGVRDYPENKMTIVNRNGVKVFEIAGYDNGSRVFKGLANTVVNYEFLPQGTYFYLLEIKTASGWKRETGWFVMKFSTN